MTHDTQLDVIETQQSDLGQYGQMALEVNAKFAAFKTIYAAKFPPPSAIAAQRDTASILIIIALIIVTIASILVSGSRTVDEFGGDIWGLFAFAMIEGAIMAFSFFRARRNSGDSRIQDSRRLAGGALFLGAVSALVANIASVLRHNGIELPSEINTAIYLMVAVSAPIMAFISSDVIALEIMSLDSRKRSASTANEEALQAWNEGLIKAWNNSGQRAWDARIKVEKEQGSREKSQNIIKYNQVSRRNKPSPKLQRALDFFVEHPEHLESASRDLEEFLPGMSYGTIHKAQRMILVERDV